MTSGHRSSQWLLKPLEIESTGLLKFEIVVEENKRLSVSTWRKREESWHRHVGNEEGSYYKELTWNAEDGRESAEGIIHRGMRFYHNDSCVFLLVRESTEC